MWKEVLCDESLVPDRGKAERLEVKVLDCIKESCVESLESQLVATAKPSFRLRSAHQQPIVVR
jgi:hypothetical protein